MEDSIQPAVISENYVADVKLFGKWSFEDVQVFIIFFF